MKLVKYLLLTAVLFSITQSVVAIERVGRLGVGFSNVVDTDTPSLSIKIQRSTSFSFGGVFGVNTGNTGGWHAGAKFYRNIFDEPFLTFYGMGSLILLNEKYSSGDSKTGFQTDLGLGAEFSLQGVESIGFSVEFGVRFKNVEELEVTTMGEHLLSAGVHFYL